MKALKFVFFLFVTASVNAKDAVTISKEISRNIEQLFNAKKFEAINKIDDDFRNSESRLPDGRWNLTFIYSNLGNTSSRNAHGEWRDKLNIANEWIRKTPSHPAPYLAKAEILISYAWDARGGGWAKSVTEPQWKLFRSRIAAARKVLDDSERITGRHPYRFLQMETIAKAQSWPVNDFIQLYNLATNLYPTYYFIHFRAASYLQPRWHGSKRALRAFVDNAVNKSKHKEGLTLYSRIYWSQLWALKDNTFGSGYAQWSSMKQGFEDIMDGYPDSIWNLNAYAYYACMAKDWKTTRELLVKIGNKPHLSIWNSKLRFRKCQELANQP